MSFFQYDGKSIFYQEYGAGKPLVFLHGKYLHTPRSPRRSRRSTNRPILGYNVYFQKPSAFTIDQMTCMNPLYPCIHTKPSYSGTNIICRSQRFVPVFPVTILQFNAFRAS